MKKFLLFSFVIFLIISVVSCSSNKTEENAKTAMDIQRSVQEEHTLSEKTSTQPKITFIELGSVNCIPCRMMQPVMRNIERKYGDQIEVVFYDVWTPEQKKYARIFGIRIIPTQVFLNSKGEEILRHEGFFPEKEIDRFLQTKGLVIQSNAGRR